MAIKLPTFAECAAVPPEKRTALERFICEWSPSLYGQKWRDQLTAVIEEERARCDAIIAHQGRAAIAGMNAAKEISGHQLQQAAKLRAESNPDALESERAMNATLTEENEALRAERDALAAENVRLREALQLIASCTPIPGASFSLVMSMTQVASRALEKETT